MWLKQMVIDGFKSYAQRTVISDWDRHFTAITGLNGSGKSNILDAICFVLGITNLSQVRVENLQQLVYKEGQARVTKASVSLVFDNGDKNESPIGYEDYDEITVTRQVVIGGRNKYMINGATAQLSRIRDLFHSVQLDVNNPHFLIMQGRITKVLNMKPHEILSMIQEAAGTKMYELKKSQAIKTMNKKQIKVNEINEILEGEITPQLEKLRKEKKHYLNWTKNNQEIEKLNRLIIKYKYIYNNNIINNNNNIINNLNEKIKSLKAEMEFLKDDIEKTKNNISIIQAKNNNKIVLDNLLNELNNKNKDLKSYEQQIKNHSDGIKREKKELKSIEKTNNLQINNKIEKEKELLNTENEYKIITEKHKYLLDRIDSLESQQLGIGMDNKKKDSGSLAKQLMEAKRLKSQYKSQLTQTKNKIKLLNKNINKHKKKIQQYQNKNNKLEKEYNNKKEKLNKLIEEKNKLLHEEPAEEEKIEEIIDNIDKKRELLCLISHELDKLKRETSKFEFKYTDPYRNFNRNCVYGKVGKLFLVSDTEYCKAIEICAGGKLYNVVVDTNETAKNLLNNGKLLRRVTIIPLNKIVVSSISDIKVEKAKKLVGYEHCNLAINLIEYNLELESAMKYVFGNSFICSDMNSAKQVAFNKEILCKSVTLDGEIFSPSGLLTGGSSFNDNKLILKNMVEFMNKKREYNKLSTEIQNLNKIYQNKQNWENKFEKLNEKIDLLNAELNVLSDRMKDSAYKNIENIIVELQNELNILSNNELIEINSKLSVSEKKCIDLSNDMNNYENKKKDQIKNVKKELIECKKELLNLENNLKQITENKNIISEEINNLKDEFNQNKNIIENINKSIKEYRLKCDEINNNIKEIKNNKKQIENKLIIERKKLSQNDSELKKLKKIVNKNEKEYSNMDINVTKLLSEITNKNDEIKISKKEISKMLSDYEWLNDININQQNNDISQQNQQNYKDLVKKQSKLKEEQSMLQSKINHKVMSMFERAENEYRDLIKKRQIIRNDKKKIESVIRELDKKKEDTLETTYKKVNEHFGNIFSKLLPGTKCKLDKINEQSSILDGLEVKVAFASDNNNNNNNNNNNIIWKESLSELSGGQRSLLALSLILSLLLFKPAPLYILDEIDAALDLSHTQNIGILIAKYFAKSQFIVVSLKEGMFTNANVIFRTSFIDGVSAVKRTIGSGLRRNNNNHT